MTWYLKQIKIAAPKDKIRRFNVTDPVLQVFIQQYEKLVDWNKVKNEEEIQDYIYDILMPSVISQIERDSSNNVYIKDVDLEAQAQQLENDPTFIHHPQYQQAMQAMQWYRMYPEQAKQQAMAIVNDEKEQVFDKWWNYLTEVNEEYSDNPAWQYIIMNSLVKSSPDTSQTMPMTLNAEALAEIWYGLKENPVPFNFMKKYQEVSAIIDAKNAEFIATDETGTNGWISIPGQKNDPQNFEENVEKLIRFSHGNDWCTAAGGAGGFLKQGNFWLYLEGGRAVVAIRTLDTGSQEMAAEIQGPGNNPPLGQVQQIKQFIDSNPNIIWDKAIHYQTLMESLAQQQPQQQFAEESEEDEEDWEALQAEWDAFDQIHGTEEKQASNFNNWYKKAQAELSYLDIGHAGWGFSDQYDSPAMKEKIWIIDKDWNFLESDSYIDGSRASHRRLWPDAMANHIARGRYHKRTMHGGEESEKVSAVTSPDIGPMRYSDMIQYVNIKNRLDKTLENKYPMADIHWF